PPASFISAPPSSCSAAAELSPPALSQFRPHSCEAVARPPADTSCALLPMHVRNVPGAQECRLGADPGGGDDLVEPKLRTGESMRHSFILLAAASVTALILS